MKKKYMTPQVEIVEMENVNLFATSITSDDVRYGGKASEMFDDEYEIDADVNANNNWNIW